MRHIRFPLVAAVATMALIGCTKNEPDTGIDAKVTEEEAGLFAQAAISADSAVTIAKARVPGRITKAELEKEDNVLIYSFDIKVAGKKATTEVHIDAASGAVLKVDEG